MDTTTQPLHSYYIHRTTVQHSLSSPDSTAWSHAVYTSGFSSYAGLMQQLHSLHAVFTQPRYTTTQGLHSLSTSVHSHMKSVHSHLTSLHSLSTSVHCHMTSLHSHTSLITYTGQLHNTTTSHLMYTATPNSAYTDFFAQPCFTF
jgi:hypothetical protein